MGSATNEDNESQLDVLVGGLPPDKHLLGDESPHGAILHEDLGHQSIGS